MFVPCVSDHESGSYQVSIVVILPRPSILSISHTNVTRMDRWEWGSRNFDFYGEGDGVGALLLAITVLSVTISMTLIKPLPALYPKFSLEE